MSTYLAIARLWMREYSIAEPAAWAPQPRAGRNVRAISRYGHQYLTWIYATEFLADHIGGVNTHKVHKRIQRNTFPSKSFAGVHWVRQLPKAIARHPTRGRTSLYAAHILLKKASYIVLYSVSFFSLWKMYRRGEGCEGETSLRPRGGWEKTRLQ